MNVHSPWAHQSYRKIAKGQSQPTDPRYVNLSMWLVLHEVFQIGQGWSVSIALWSKPTASCQQIQKKAGFIFSMLYGTRIITYIVLLEFYLDEVLLRLAYFWRYTSPSHIYFTASDRTCDVARHKKTPGLMLENSKRHCMECRYQKESDQLNVGCPRSAKTKDPNQKSSQASSWYLSNLVGSFSKHFGTKKIIATSKKGLEFWNWKIESKSSHQIAGKVCGFQRWIHAI